MKEALFSRGICAKQAVYVRFNPAVTRFFPTVTLRRHYRAVHLALVDADQLRARSMMQVFKVL